MEPPEEDDSLMATMGIPEDTDPDCQITGCDRPGEIPQKVRGDDPEEPLAKHYICQYHHRLFLAIKITVALVLIGIFLVAFFSL